MSFLIAYISTKPTISYFKKKGWLEDPLQKQKKTGNATALYPVPRGGGIPIYISIVIVSLLFLPKDSHLSSIVISASICLFVGLIDDVYDISPIFRLFINVVIATIVISSGIRITYLSNPLGSIGSVVNLNSSIGYIATVLWIVWCTNIVGWSAGVEGQMAGFVSISALFLGIVGLRYSSDTTQWPVIILAIIVSGSYAGFLPFNFYPQKIMPGYSGKSLAGFYLSIISILSGAKLATLMFLLAVPMIDAVFVIFRRLKDKKPIYLGDGQHLHHLLLKRGLSRPQIAIFYWLVSLILGCFSLLLSPLYKLLFLLVFFFLFLVFILQLSDSIQPRPNR